MMDAWADTIRIVNVALSVICVVLLLRKAALYWGEYQSRTKDFWWVLMCWSLAIGLGTLEVLLGWDTQFRVLFTAAALLLTVKVLLRPNEVGHPTFTNEF